MNVAIPISRFDRSGGIRVLTVLANGLAGRGYDLSFVVPRGDHQPFFSLDERVAVHVIGRDFGRTVVGGLAKKFQLAFGLPRVDAAIANAFMTAYSVRFSQIIGRTKRALYFVQHYEPIAFGEYGDGSVWLKMTKKKIAQLTYHLGLECVTNSKWTAQMLEDKHHAFSTIAPLGVDTKIFRPITLTNTERSGPTILMAIGNANRIKRFDLFLKAAVFFQKKADCKIIIATHDKSLSRLEGVSAEFIAPKNDFELAQLYNRASIFVSTSAMEGFGLPLLEAMACGTPVVTTDSGGIRDFCQDGVNCLIAKSDEPEDLAEAIMEICSNSTLEARLIENGLLTASQWPWERLIDTFDGLLQPNPTSHSAA